MNAKQLSAVVGLFLGAVGPTFAATSTSQGVIHFHGSIVESPCVPASQASAKNHNTILSLDRCPRLSRGNVIDVHRVGTETVSAVGGSKPAVRVKLIADSGDASSLYYNQQYALIDAAGKQINTGTYIVTLTSP